MESQSTPFLAWGEPPWRCDVNFGRHDVPSDADVVIVGGGLTGAAAACRLARAGAKTVLLERWKIGAGASGRTGGIVLQGTAKGIMPGTERCVEYLSEVVQREGIECELKLHGCWEIEHTESNTDGILPWKDADKQIRVRRLVPGGTVNPMKLLVGLIQSAIRAGATVCENSPVRRIVRQTGLKIETCGRTILTEHAVVALNAWTNVLLPETPKLSTALTVACATEPLSKETLHQIGLGNEIPFYTLDFPYLWGRCLSDNRVIFGAGLVFGQIYHLEKLSINDEDVDAKLEQLKTRVRGLNPALSEVQFSCEWVGPIAITEDFLPIISRVSGAPHIFVAGGYAGHGVALSVWAGELIARAILHNEELPRWAALPRT